MSATVLTPEAAKDAKIDIIANGKGTQAVHDAVVAMRANRRSGTAQHQDQGDRQRLAARSPTAEGHRHAPAPVT